VFVAVETEWPFFAANALSLIASAKSQDALNTAVTYLPINDARKPAYGRIQRIASPYFSGPMGLNREAMNDLEHPLLAVLVKS